MKLPDFLILPAEMLNLDEMSLIDGYIYGYIYWVNQQKLERCTTSNQEFSEIFHVTPRTIQFSLKRLEKFDFITIDYTENGERIEIVPNITLQAMKKISWGGEKNFIPYINSEANAGENDQLSDRERKEEKEKKVIQRKEKEEKKEIYLQNYKSDYLVNIPLQDIPLLRRDTSATESKIRSKGEDLYNWLKATGKERKYKDFRALLRNAIKRDFPPLMEGGIDAKHFRGY